jgi:hypothetical protein
MAVETPIVSETLQKTFRDNFPGQVSSGRDIHVSDTIIPIVDFSAETTVTGLRSDLQSAIDFNVTSFDVTNTTTTVLNTTGFWSISAVFNSQGLASGLFGSIFLDDGTTTKLLAKQEVYNGGGSPVEVNILTYNKIILLKTGVSLKIQSNNLAVNVNGTCRQIAALDGTLQNPDGYTGS